jgi:hypothetical protein
VKGRVTGVMVCLIAALVSGRGVARGQQPSGVQGTIAGQVIDAATGDPIIEAGVEVIGLTKTVRTDLDGRYSVKVPPGTYQVRFFAPLYQGARLEKVVVEPNKVATADTPLRPEGKAGVEVVEVVAQASKAAEATQLIKRQKATVVEDNIGAETIRKSPDIDAAEIVKRVPAVTIKDNKFIFVRGLGERYSSAVLDGSRLPSPDPERRVIPLDLFPSEFIESISVVKTFTPDLPGDFSGGLADIELLDFPQQLTYGMAVSTSGNSETTFQKFQSYKGSHLDPFGFGGGYRALPDSIPGRNLGNSSQTSPSQLQAFGRSFKTIWQTDDYTAPPDFNTVFQVGDRWGPLGARLAVNYRNKHETIDHQTEVQFIQNGDVNDPVPKPGDQFIFDTNTFETTLSSVLAAAYELSPTQHITLRALMDRNSVDQVTSGNGHVEQCSCPGQSQELSYTQNELDYGQLGGNHHFERFDLDWRSALSRTTQNVPDQRFITRQADAQGGDLTLTNDSNGGTRDFQDLTEYLTDSQVDFTVPFLTKLPFTDVWSGLPAKLKFGPAYLHRNRDSSIRTFNFALGQSPGGPQIDLAGPANEVFSPPNIGGAAPYPVRFQEVTQPQDTFNASQEVGAGYFLIDAPLIRDRLRLITGVRTEYSYIKLHTVNPQTPTIPAIIRKENLDPLPAVNLIYSLRSDMNLRAAWSQTVTRPEFRELSPALYPAPRGLRAKQGVPTLVETGVDSYDLRWEWFFSPTEVVTLGGFYKTIANPIEAAVEIGGSASIDTQSQNKDGKLAGFEFELRKNLGFFTPVLEHVNFLTNVTYVHSEVTGILKQQVANEVTFRKRALQGQADYVVNAAIEYAHPEYGTVRLLFNAVGPTISAVQDENSLPDFVTAERNQLDLVYLVTVHPGNVPLNLKLSVENLLNDNYLTTVGDVVQQNYRTGVTASFGVSYNY